MASLVRRLARSGWDVHVIAARRASEQHADTDSAGFVPEGVTVERTGSMELYRRINAGLRGGGGSSLSRWLRRLAVLPLLPLYPLSRFPDKQVGWTLHLFFALRRALRERGDCVVLSSSPPHSCTIPVALLRRTHRFRWVADFRDPWTAPVRQPSTMRWEHLQRRIERRVLGRADAIIANTPGNRDALLEVFPEVDARRVEVITNGFDPELSPAEVADDAGLDAADLVYVGEIYPGMLGLYLAAAGIIAKRGGRVPRLVAYGIFDEREREAARAAGLLDSIEHRGVVGWQRSLAVMRAAPALLLLLEHHPRWHSCVPSKLYPYLQAGRPVLALVPAGDASAILERTGAGVAVTSSDAAEVARAIEAFVDAPRTIEPDPVAIEQYDMNHIAARIERVMTGGGADG